MPTSPRLGFTYLVTGQALPETAVNEIAAFLEAAAGHFIFIDRDLATPPVSPANGACYLVAASPTGTWTGHAGDIALFLNTAWVFVEVTEGYTAWILDEPGLYGYDGATWNLLAAPSGSFQPLDAELTALAGLTSAANKIPRFTGSGTADLLTLDTDTALAANSDTKLASQKAVKAYVDAAVTGLLDLKGTTDCSANPNYPAASKGDYYVVTVAGKIGGASGATVAVGDVYFATADNAGGTQASVGSSWDILVHASVAAGGGLLAANNLSDLANAGTARTNLGLGTSATVNTGTSGATIPLLNGANTYSGLLAFSAGADVTPATTPSTTAVGYLGAPQNTQNATYTTVMADAGKHLYHTSGSAHTWTIDSNANVAYPIGTILTFINENAGGVVTLAITSDTLRWGSSTGSRSLAANGTATALKVASTTWRLTGDGIT